MKSLQTIRLTAKRMSNDPHFQDKPDVRFNEFEDKDMLASIIQYMYKHSWHQS